MAIFFKKTDWDLYYNDKMRTTELPRTEALKMGLRTKDATARDEPKTTFDSKKWITVKKSSSDYKNKVKTYDNGLSNCFHDFLHMAVFCPYWTNSGTKGKWIINSNLGYSCPIDYGRRFDTDKMKNWLLSNYSKSELQHGAVMFRKFENHLITFSIYKESPVFKICPKAFSFMEIDYYARGMQNTYQQNGMFLNQVFVEWFVDLAERYDTHKSKNEHNQLIDFVQDVETQVRRRLKERQDRLKVKIDFPQYFDDLFTYIMTGKNKQSVTFRALDTYHLQLDLDTVPVTAKKYTTDEIHKMYWEYVTTVIGLYKTKAHYKSLVHLTLDDVVKSTDADSQLRKHLLENYSRIVMEECRRSRELLEYVLDNFGSDGKLFYKMER
jgi:hypothetical protein